MSYLLAVDQGTSSSRAILFNADGKILSVAQKDFTQFFPSPGWVEHDALGIWDTQQAVIQKVIEQSKIAVKEIKAIGITNQRETTVIWDKKTGVPIAPAIVWQDRRTTALCEELKRKGHADEIRKKTGLVIDPYFSATKIKWLLDNIPNARADAEAGNLCFGTIDSWLVWKMTNGTVHVTDPSNASRTMLSNIHTNSWDESLLKLFNIPQNILPAIVPSSGIIGEYLGIPIAGIAGDQQAALFGQGCHTLGSIKNTYGTGCFLLMNTGTKAVSSDNNLVTTTAWQIGSTVSYALEGSVFMGGAVVQWLRDNLGIINSSDQIEALAESVSSAEGVIFVPAFTGLGAPYWDADARASLSGLNRGSTKAHIARAALEGIAFQVADVIDAMQKDTAMTLTELRVDGGATVNNLLMQIQADILGIPVRRSAMAESTAFGAAALAGLAVKVFSSEADIAGLFTSDKVFEPTLSHSDRMNRLAQWHQAVRE